MNIYGEVLKNSFMSLIQEHLAEKPHSTLDALEKYAESTVSSINYLLLETINVRDVRVDHAASHLGKAQGIVTTIRATPFHASKRRVLLPMDVLIKHGASAEVLCLLVLVYCAYVGACQKF